MNENMEFPDMSGEDIEWLQDSFVKVVFERIEVSLIDRPGQRPNKKDAGKVSIEMSRFPKWKIQINAERVFEIGREVGTCITRNVNYKFTHLSFFFFLSCQFPEANKSENGQNGRFNPFVCEVPSINA
jgi:hypothetical protein